MQVVDEVDAASLAKGQASLAGAQADGLEDVALAGARVAVDEDIFGVLDKVQPCKLQDGRLVERGLEVKWEDLGFRNEINNARFMWDMIDPDDEGGEPTDESASSLVALFEDMDCSSTSGLGAERNCNEPNPTDSSGYVTCKYPDPTLHAPLQFPPAIHHSTRDSYNAYDFSVMIPLNQAEARRINCLYGAKD